jgi:hypothetical protein
MGSAALHWLDWPRVDGSDGRSVVAPSCHFIGSRSLVRVDPSFVHPSIATMESIDRNKLATVFVWNKGMGHTCSSKQILYIPNM